MFSCSGDYYLIRQLMLPPSQSQGVLHVKLQKRNGIYWLQADRRDTVDHKSSTNTLAGFHSMQMAPIQEGESDVAVAEPLPNAAGGLQSPHERPCPLNRDSRLRAVEPDEWAMKVRAKPLPEASAQRQRDIHELAHLPPVPWCPACVSGKTADDPHRRRQDARDSGLGRCFV